MTKDPRFPLVLGKSGVFFYVLRQLQNMDLRPNSLQATTEAPSLCVGADGTVKHSAA